MIVVKDSPLEVGWLSWAIAPPSWSLVVAVKATFEIPPEGGVCELASTQELPTGDLYEDEDWQRPLRHPNDFAIGKPHGEVVLRGTAHAPRGRPVTSLLAGFRFGTVHKELAVVGDRFWKGGLLGGMTEPAPFASMPLSWERAFGGPGQPNPNGKGITPVLADGAPRVPLPNLEERTRMIRDPGARPLPAGAGAISPQWPARLRGGGTYDAEWQRTRWPFFPADFEWGNLNAAPVDQRIVGYWKGDEALELTHLHPDQTTIRARLPGLRPRCVTAVRVDPRGAPAIQEVRLVLDTVVIDADALKVYATWRGNRPIAEETHRELEQLFLTHEPLEQPMTPVDLARAYHAELARREAEEQAHEAVPMPSPGGAHV